MQSRIYRTGLVFLVALISVLATAAFSAEAANKQLPIKSVEPGVLGKVLKVSAVEGGTKARLVIEGLHGRRQTIVVYGGDVRLGMFAAGVNTGNCPAR